MKNVTIIIFEEDGYPFKLAWFNKPIVLPKNIITFVGGFVETHRVVLTSCIEKMTFGNNNYDLVDNLPNGIKKIILGGYYDVSLDNIPNSVVDVGLGQC